MSDFSARAETELTIDDDWMEANKDNSAAVIDCINRSPAVAFIASHRNVTGTKGSRTAPMFQFRGISINGARGDQGGVDLTATSAMINRSLLNNMADKPNVIRRSCAIIHPEMVSFIYPHNTTARGISLYC